MIRLAITGRFSLNVKRLQPGVNEMLVDSGFVGHGVEVDDKLAEKTLRSMRCILSALAIFVCVCSSKGKKR
jgi:hypothetical protein